MKTAPLPASSTPKDGEFYTVQHAKDWPPLPANTLNLPLWDLGEGLYILDDRDLKYSELPVSEISESGTAMTSMRSAINNSLAEGVYLTNLVATLLTNQMTVASFDIAGGTNYVAYDIWRTSDLTSQISLSQWTWLGIGYTSNRYIFTDEPPDQAFYALATPQKTMVVGWGNNSALQCEVPYGLTNALAVTGGYEQSLALLSNGAVVPWGSGDANWVPTNLVGVTMIAAGWNHNIALLTDGTVTAWGDNGSDLGWHLTEVPSSLTNATVISAQALHSLALRSNGTVVAWGYNPNGETNVPSGLSNVVAIAAGGEHNLAAKSDGTVTAWGLNDFGQCNVPAGLSNVKDVAAGWAHSIAMKSDGTVVAWAITAMSKPMSLLD
ncbi:MAG: RCC1 domain-containing protein [Limisphaerales bacterium]